MKRGINKIKLFESLDKETKENLSNSAVIKKYKKGDLLYSDKEKINTVYFVLKGVAALYKLNPDNTRKVVFLFGEGYVLNEVIIYDNTTTLSCKLLTNAKLLKIPREKFVEVL